MKLTVNRNTQYFAIKDSIFAAIRYFQKRKSNNSVQIEATHIDGNLDMEFDRDVIINFLGYDFRRKKKRFEKDCKMGGKLYHKTSILMLFSLLIKVPTV